MSSYGNTWNRSTKAIKIVVKIHNPLKLLLLKHNEEKGKLILTTKSED